MIQAKAEADERIALAEKKIKELSKATIFNNDKQCLSNKIIIMIMTKAIHARKILLDENTDKLLRNTSLAKKKEVTVHTSKT